MTKFETRTIDEQIIALPIMDTASGSIATFDTDLTENLVEVKCQIVAKQASGTPSPVSPLPIQTYDSLTLYHNDINVWNEQAESGLYNVSTGEKQANANYMRSVALMKVQPETTYYLSTIKAENYIGCFDSNKAFLTTRTRSNSGTFTTPAGCYFISLTFSGTAYNHDISINYPSTDTQYHAFNGAYIPFGQTVANGVIDITTGKLRVTHGYYKVSNTTDLTAFSASSTYGSFACVNDIGVQVIDVNKVNVIASMAQGVKYTDRVADVTVCRVFTDEQGYVVLRASASDNITNVNDLRTLFTDCEICYELATPIEIQLDSITLQALLNENNIWCDTGDTEVKYLLTVGRAS